MLGRPVANVALPRRVGLGGRLRLAFVVVYHQHAVLVDAGVLVAIKLPNLATFFYSEEIFARAGSGFLV